MKKLLFILLLIPSLIYSQKKISFSYDLSLGDTIILIETADNIKNNSFECDLYFPNVDTCFDVTFVNSIDDSTYHNLSHRAFPVRIYPSNYDASNKHDIIRWDEHYGSEKAYVNIESCSENTGTVFFNILFSEASNDAEHAHDVFIQDNITEPIELYLFRNEGNVTLASEVSVGDRTFTVDAGHSIAIGDIACFQEGRNISQFTVVNVATNTITVDNTFDKAYSISAGCAYGSPNLAVNGSVTPVVFAVSPSRLMNGQAWDITRMIIVMNDETAMDDGLFGSRAKLTYGLMFRKKNNEYKNLFNIKTNGDFRLSCFDVEYVDKAPAGTYSIGIRKSFNGQDKYGVVLRLYSEFNDEYQCVVQDDLTTQTLINVKIQGHFADLSFN